MVKGDDLIPLLGRPLGSPAIEELRQALDAAVEVDEYEDASFLSFPEHGIELLFGQDSALESVFLFAEGEDDARQFEGDLPQGLRFEMSREMVRRLLGEPQETGGGEVFLREEVLPWDKYKRNGWILHVRYSSSLDAVRRVGLALRKGLHAS